MNCRKTLIAGSVAVLLAFPSFTKIAAADPAPLDLVPPVHIKSSFRLISDGGTDKKFPPSYILDEPTYQWFDKRFTELENNETRILAENKELKDGANRKHYIYLGIVFVAGALVGGYAVSKY